MNFTEKLASFTVQMRNMEIDPQVIEQYQKLCLDYLCAAITGAQTDVGKNVFQYFKSFDHEQSVSVIGHQSALSYLHAAFVNGTSAHCLDFDDGHTQGSVHPGSVIFPAVLAVAEKRKSHPDDIVRATIVGYEITIRVASAMHPFSRQNGYHNTPVAGVFGAAAAVSYLLDADMKQVEGALGNASSFAGGTFAFLGSGSELKRIHPGIAARDGIIAAEMVLRNVDGPKNIFEKPGGVFDIFARGKINHTVVEVPIGDELEFMNVYFKAYPCCRHLHVVIDAIKKLKNQHQITPDQVTKIVVGVNRVTSYHEHRTCASLLDAQMSLPYAAAVALIDKNVTVKSFNLERVDKRKILALMQRVSVYEDETCEKLYPQKRKTKVTIHMKEGEVFRISYDKVKGEPPNPMSMQDVENKIQENCNDLIGETKVRQLIERVRNLDVLDLNV